MALVTGDLRRRAIMIVQRYVVLLEESADRQLWLGYDVLGRIGNGTFAQAFRYDTEQEAQAAIRRVRHDRRWPGARVMAVAEDEPAHGCKCVAYHDSESLVTREQLAMAWLFSGEAGELQSGEARRIVRERFGEDVEKSLQRKFTDQ